LTKIGLELLRIVKAPFSPERFKEVVARIPKGGLTKISLLDHSVLWPEPVQNESSATNTPDNPETAARA
jgi:hypothetical protein